MDGIQEQTGDWVDNTARANAIRVSEQLKQSRPILSDLVDKGRLKVVSAFYHLDSGEIEIFS
jgi:carbonic anhydrase